MYNIINVLFNAWYNFIGVNGPSLALALTSVGIGIIVFFCMVIKGYYKLEEFDPNAIVGFIIGSIASFVGIISLPVTIPMAILVAIMWITSLGLKNVVLKYKYRNREFLSREPILILNDNYLVEANKEVERVLAWQDIGMK